MANTQRDTNTHIHTHTYGRDIQGHTHLADTVTLSFFVFHVGKLKLFDLQLYVADSKVVSGAPHAAWPAVAQRQLTLPCQRAGEGEKGAVV